MTNEWNGEKEVPEFHTVIAWEKLSDRLARGRKGAVVNVVGRLQTRKWKDASGAEGGTTDARAIQLARAGVPVGCVSIPCRYIHAPSEMVDMADVQSAIQMLKALVSGSVELG